MPAMFVAMLFIGIGMGCVALAAHLVMQRHEKQRDFCRSLRRYAADRRRI